MATESLDDPRGAGGGYPLPLGPDPEARILSLFPVIMARRNMLDTLFSPPNLFVPRDKVA